MEWSPASIANRLHARKSAVQQVCHRLAARGQVERIRRGWYRAIPRLPSELSESVRLDLYNPAQEPLPFGVHNLQFVYKADAHHPDKLICPISSTTPPLSSTVLLDPTHASGLRQRWRGTPRLDSPRTGTRYRYSWGEDRSLEVAFWSTGSIGLFVECSSNPLSGADMPAFTAFLNALFHLQADVSWSDLDPFFRLSLIETNHDSPVQRSQAAGLSRLNLTFQAVSGEIVRIYEKQLASGSVLRREIVKPCITDGETVNETAHQLLTLMGGLDGSMLQMMAAKNYEQLQGLAKEVSRLAWSASNNAAAAVAAVDRDAADRSALRDEVAGLLRAVRDRLGPSPEPDVPTPERQEPPDERTAIHNHLERICQLPPTPPDPAPSPPATPKRQDPSRDSGFVTYQLKQRTPPQSVPPRASKPLLLWQRTRTPLQTTTDPPPPLTPQPSPPPVLEDPPTPVRICGAPSTRRDHPPGTTCTELAGHGDLVVSGSQLPWPLHQCQLPDGRTRYWWRA